VDSIKGNKNNFIKKIIMLPTLLTIMGSYVDNVASSFFKNNNHVYNVGNGSNEYEYDEDKEMGTLDLLVVL